MTDPQTAPESRDFDGHYRALLGKRTISRDDFEVGEEKVITISRVTQEDVVDMRLSSAELEQRKKAGESIMVTKGAIHIKGTDRMLVLNDENALALVELFGKRTRDWVGQRVCLHRIERKFFGKIGAVRIKAAPARAAATAPEQPADAGAEGRDG